VEEVVVEELSRLGRNTVDVLTTLNWLEEKSVNVVVRGMGNLQSHIDGKKNPIWNMITSVMSSIYELERENILERTSIGRKIYVKNGGKLGRPVGSNENEKEFLRKEKSQLILKYLRKGKYSMREIVKLTESSLQTVSKVKKAGLKYGEISDNQPHD
jgi:DNA invertase Pin-like site-specific DNA recombinase